MAERPRKPKYAKKPAAHPTPDRRTAAEKAADVDRFMNRLLVKPPAAPKRKAAGNWKPYAGTAAVRYKQATEGDQHKPTPRPTAKKTAAKPAKKQ